MSGMPAPRFTVALAWKRCWRTLAYWLTAVGFAQALVWTLKMTLERARPMAMYDGADRFSFPSGHAASSIVLYGFLAFLLAHGKSPKINLKADEKELAQRLQREDTWRHLWRITGLYANVSIFDVADAQTLHDTLKKLRRSALDRLFHKVGIKTLACVSVLEV
jgi:muconolactone delta-isomerase